MPKVTNEAELHLEGHFYMAVLRVWLRKATFYINVQTQIIKPIITFSLNKWLRTLDISLLTWVVSPNKFLFRMFIKRYTSLWWWSHCTSLDSLSTIKNNNNKLSNKASITSKYSQYSHKAPHYSEKITRGSNTDNASMRGLAGSGRHP